MAIIAGRNTQLQIGLETAWGTAVAPTVVIDYTKEDLKDMRVLTEEDILVGRSLTARIDDMAEKATGSFDTIVKPDNIGLLLGCTCGAEAATTAQTNVAEVTEITCPADVAGSLGGKYFLLNDPTTSYYVWYDVASTSSDPAVAGKTGIEVDITTAMTAAQVASATSSAIAAEADFGAAVALAVVTVTNANAGAATDASDYNSGCTFEVTTDGYGGTSAASTAKKHAFTPVAGGSANSLPSFTAVIDRSQAVKGYVSLKVTSMNLSCAVNDYLRGSWTCIGHSEQTDTLESLTASTKKPFTFKGGEVRMNSYKYATVTGLSFTWDNKLEDDLYTLDGTTKMREIEPQGREIMADLDVLYDADTESLRENSYKTGTTVNVRLYFETEEEIETGYKYYLEILMPYSVIMEDPSFNVSGPDRITGTLKLKATQPGATAGCTITLGDAQATDYIN